jgi:hypothetical protein
MTIPEQTHEPGGIVQELLRTPLIKDILRSSLTSVKHKDGKAMIHTLMGQDPEVFLSLAVTIPALLNLIVRSIAELGRQMKAQYAPGILTAFMESLAREIDTVSLKECGIVWKDLAASLWKASPEARKALLDAGLAKGPGIGAQGINALSRVINDLERGRPGALSALLSGVLAEVDKAEWSRASHTLAGAFLDQKWHVLSWSLRLLAGRIREKTGRKRS